MILEICTLVDIFTLRRGNIMDKISHDVYKSINVVNSNMLYVESKYNTLFFSTNENLDKLFSKIDVNGKNVLSVLWSGDHAFHLYNNGSSSVDVFDVNKLTIYYYICNHISNFIIIAYFGYYYRDFLLFICI